MNKRIKPTQKKKYYNTMDYNQGKIQEVKNNFIKFTLHEELMINLSNNDLLKLEYLLKFMIFNKRFSDIIINLSCSKIQAYVITINKNILDSIYHIELLDNKNSHVYIKEDILFGKLFYMINNICDVIRKIPTRNS